MIDHNQEKELKIIASRMRKHIIESVYSAKSGHPGGSLSCTEIIASIYFNLINVDPENPKWEDRDRFVLSKGHCAPALYAALAIKGFFPEEDIKTLRKIDSYLEGHPNMNSVPGVDMSTGSLGQGISAAVGMALGAKVDGKQYRVYALLGDGELQEGQVWEAAMSAAHYRLDNLIAFVDYNGLQIDGKITDVMSPVPIDEKFRAFGWDVKTIDGHDFKQIIATVENRIKETEKADIKKPFAIICETVKGKGVSFMEGKAEWHGTAPKEEQKNMAIKEIEDRIKELEGC